MKTEQSIGIQYPTSCCVLCYLQVADWTLRHSAWRGGSMTGCNLQLEAQHVSQQIEKKKLRTAYSCSILRQFSWAYFFMEMDYFQRQPVELTIYFFALNKRDTLEDIIYFSSQLHDSLLFLCNVKKCGLLCHGFLLFIIGTVIAEKNYFKPAVWCHFRFLINRCCYVECQVQRSMHP